MAGTAEFFLSNLQKYDRPSQRTETGTLSDFICQISFSTNPPTWGRGFGERGFFCSAPPIASVIWNGVIIGHNMACPIFFSSKRHTLQKTFLGRVTNDTLYCKTLISKSFQAPFWKIYIHSLQNIRV